MKPIKLNNGLLFTIERHETQARLVVLNNNVEKVCRKERFKTIWKYVRSGENQLFKGRLRLHKNVDGIAVEVKGEIAGVIKAEDFINCLEMAQQKGL
jgi:hypothetical protein